MTVLLSAILERQPYTCSKGSRLHVRVAYIQKIIRIVYNIKTFAVKLTKKEIMVQMFKLCAFLYICLVILNKIIQ